MPRLTRAQPKHDRAILELVRRARIAELRQVGHALGIARGRSVVYVYRRVRVLRRAKFLREHPLPGGDSRRVALTLSPKGYAELDVAIPREHPALTLALREHRLQTVEMSLVREAEGWEYVPSTDSHRVARDWALQAMRARGRSATRRLEEDRLRNWEADEARPMPPLLTRTDERLRIMDLRIILHAHPRRSFKRMLHDLPLFPFFPPLQFELVCADMRLREIFHDQFRRWLRQRKVLATVHEVADYRARPNPIPPCKPGTRRHRPSRAGWQHWVSYVHPDLLDDAQEFPPTPGEREPLIAGDTSSPSASRATT